MISLVQFIHVASVVTIIGLYLVSFIFLAINIKHPQSPLFRSALMASLLADIFIFLLLLIICLSGVFLVFYYDFSFEIPWLKVARIFSMAVASLWFVSLLIKLKNYYADMSQIFYFKKIFYLAQFMVFVIFCLAVHDAVTQSTWFFSGA